MVKGHANAHFLSFVVGSLEGIVHFRTSLLYSHDVRSTVVRPVLGWLALRILTGVLVAGASYWMPITEFEKSVAIWPPSGPAGRWLYRLLLAPWDRWDVTLYKQIALVGYSSGNGTTQFHPLYPWLAAPLARLLDAPTIALLLVSSLAGLVCWVVLLRLWELDFSEEDAWFGSLLWVCFPVSFILFAPYSEALFLLWTVLSFLQARRQRWWLTGGLGALAVLTRRQGILLLLPLAWEVWYSRSKRWKELWRHPEDWIPLLLIPLALGFWIAYRGLVLSDIPNNARDFQSLVYSFLISPDAQHVVPVQEFFWPWQVLGWAVKILLERGNYQHVLDLGVAGFFVMMTVIGWRHLRPSYRLYVLAVILVSFSYYTGPIYPYMGLPRHLWLGFPVFVSVSQAVRQRRARLLLLGGSSLLMAWMVTQYVFHVWVP